MSKIKQSGYSGTLTKKQRNELLKSLESYYLFLIDKNEAIVHKYANINASALKLYDRRIRAHLKSCEILLISLKSPLFENVKSASIRRTLTIEGRRPGFNED